MWPQYSQNKISIIDAKYIELLETKLIYNLFSMYNFQCILPVHTPYHSDESFQPTYSNVNL